MEIMPGPGNNVGDGMLRIAMIVMSIVAVHIEFTL